MTWKNGSDIMQGEDNRSKSYLYYGSNHALKTSLSKLLVGNIPVFQW